MVDQGQIGARRVRIAHQPALDGVRAVAIIAVLLYHGGVVWAQGGFLGVEVFFVLSGFLITTLLLTEWTNTSCVRLSSFWARRARRLLPALFVLVLVIGLYYALGGPVQAMPGIKGSALATLMYVGNWHEIATGSNYFLSSGPVSPLQHTWSLAIEEQFYLIWPLVLLAIFSLVNRTARTHSRERSLMALLAITAAGAVGSGIEVIVLYSGGRGLERVYYGTDTRATGLLIGATLAIAIALHHSHRTTVTLSRHRAQLLGAAAVGLLLGLFMAMHLATGQSQWLFPWGMLGSDAAVAGVIACAMLLPGSAVTKLLSARPLCAIGAISYGLYLWHFPCFVWLDEQATGLRGGALFALRIAATVAVALASYFVVEQPIRQRRVSAAQLRLLAPTAAVGTVAVVFAAGAASAQMPGRTFAPVPRLTMARYAGRNGPCRVRLRDKALYRTVPLPPAQTGGYVFHWILRHAVDWNGGGYRNAAAITFHTCPPDRVLFIGDSIAFTAGVPMLHDEDRYGVELANAAILGCAFGTRGSIEISGVFTRLPVPCRDALQRWQRAEAAFHPQAVLVELGYRDEFDWSWHHEIVHLGEPTFDRYVRAQVERFIQALVRGKTRIVFLTVPFVQPPPLPNGDPAPAGSTRRHALINSILRSVARAYPTHVSVLNIDKIVSPGSHYTRTINGSPCRFDGIHFTTFCASLLQPYVLAGARSVVLRKGARS